MDHSWIIRYNILVSRSSQSASHILQSTILSRFPCRDHRRFGRLNLSHRSQMLHQICAFLHTCCIKLAIKTNNLSDWHKFELLLQNFPRSERVCHRRYVNLQILFHVQRNERRPDRRRKAFFTAADASAAGGVSWPSWVKPHNPRSIKTSFTLYFHHC